MDNEVNKSSKKASISPREEREIEKIKEELLGKATSAKERSEINEIFSRAL